MAFYGNAGNANVTVDPGAGNYGSANKIPIITVDSDQRISAINESADIIQDASINANAAVGAIGSYAFMETSDGNSSYNPGQTLAGSSLRYADATGRTHTDTPSGNWRCMGYDSGSARTNTGTGNASGSGNGNVSVNVNGSGNVSVNSISVSGTGTASGQTVNVSGKGNFGVNSDSFTVNSSGTGTGTANFSGSGNGTAAVNVNSNVTVNTVVAYSATLWLRYS